MHTTLINRVCQTVIAFLLCTGAAWGQTYDSIGNATVTGTDENWTSIEALAIGGTGATSYFYTALAGDTVIACSTYTREGTSGGTDDDTLLMAAYTVSGNMPDARAYAPDTIIVTTNTIGWWGRDGFKHALTEGVTYTVGICAAGGGTDDWVQRFTAGGGNVVTYNNNNTELPATWEHESVSTNIRIFYLVVQHAASAPSALRIGTSIIGVTKLAPPE